MKYSEDVIEAFLSEPTLTDIARKTGKSYSTIRRYNDDESFQELLDERRKAYVKKAVQRMQSSFCDCVEETLRIIRNPEEKSQIKLNAIQILFNQCRSWTEDIDIIERLKLLENGQNTDYFDED